MFGGSTFPLASVVERLITALLMFAVARGWITTADVAPIVAVVVAAGSAAYGWWRNRPTNLVSRTLALPEVEGIKPYNGGIVNDPSQAETVISRARHGPG